MSSNPVKNEEAEELPPSLSKKEEKVEENDDDVLTEILGELQAKVGEGVASALKSLPINKQIKILKGIVAGQKEQKKAERKVSRESDEDEEDEPKDTRKRVSVKKIVKPSDIETASAETKDDEFTPLAKRFANKEEWLNNFMNSEKLYYKGNFKRTG
jgi:hypothetical protein